MLPSDRESWGLVVNEALATGLPVVVSDAVGCMPDLVVPASTGELFRGGDVDDLAAALGRVRDPGGRERMGDACRAHVAQVLVCRSDARPGRGGRSRSRQRDGRRASSRAAAAW